VSPPNKKWRRRERWGGAPKDDEMMLSYDEIMKKCS